MAKFTAPVRLNFKWNGLEISGAAGATHRIPDAFVEEFTGEVAPSIPGGVTWITQDETSGIPTLPIAQSNVSNLTSDLAGKYDKAGGTISGAVTVTGTMQANAKVGVLDSPSERIPVNIGAAITGSVAVANGTSDTIGINLAPRFTGDFTGLGGADPGFVWGVNDFTQIGQTGSTGGSGINDATALLAEMAVVGSSGLSATSGVRALHADISFFGTSAGGTVASMEGLRVSGPRRKNGATGGSVTNAFGVLIEAPSGIGSNANFALYTEGGPSRFNGRLDVDTSVSGFNKSVEVFADFSRANGASIKLDTNTAGGNIVSYLSTTAAYLGVSDGTNVVHKLKRNGIVQTGGTSFPASPSANDLYYRTDLAELYYYDGTRWLSQTKYSLYLGPSAGGSGNVFPINVTAFPLIGPVPYNTIGTRRDVYLVGWRVVTNVTSAQSVSNFWTIALERHPSGTSIASFNTQGDSANTQTEHGGSIGALIGTTDTRLALNCTKNGTPGTLDAPTFLEYRLVAT